MEFFELEPRTQVHNSKKHGFTLVEMLVVTPFVILLLGAFVAVAVNLTGEALVSRAQSSLLHSMNSALERIRTDVRISEGFLSTSSFPLVSPQGSDENTAAFKNATPTSNALILRLLAVTDRPDNPEAQPINLINAPLALCTHPGISGNQRMVVNAVYFVRDNSLWRRILMPANYTTIGCDTPWRLPTCEPGYPASATQCKASDERLVDGVTPADFKLEYFSSPSSQTALTDASNGNASDAVRTSVLETATSVRITITAKQSPAGRDVEESLSTRTMRSVGRPS